MAATYHYPVTFTIPASDAVSDSQSVGSVLPVGVYMPAAWDAAVLCFDVSLDGENWLPLFDQTGTEVSVAVAASKAFVINPADYAGFPYMRVRSGLTGATVDQTAERAVTVLFRKGD